MNESEISRKIATYLLEIKAVQINTTKAFRWASGWQSPVYCDNRKTLSYPAIRTYIKEQLASTIKNEYKDVHVIAGVATAGIPQGALVADALGLPFVYVRSSAKGHGLENRIEGVLQKDVNVVVIEDLVSTGGSSMQAIDALRTASASVIGLCSIFSYGFPQSEKLFNENSVKHLSLSNLEALMQVARSENLISEEVELQMQQWMNAPETWGEQT